MREISSESNPHFRTLRDLLTGRGVRKHGQALVAGPRIIDTRFETDSPTGSSAWITDDTQPPPAADEAEWYRLTRPLFKELDVAGTNAPLLLVSAPPRLRWSTTSPGRKGAPCSSRFRIPRTSVP